MAERTAEDARALFIALVEPAGISPTPQLHDDADGDLCVTWLVSARSLDAAFWGGGSATAWVTEPDGTQHTTVDVDPGQPWSDAALDSYRQVLAEMGARVTHPISGVR